MIMKNLIESGSICIGIEFGSTRIKAVMTDADGNVLASGGHNWENRLENGLWVYTPEQIHTGLQKCYADLAAETEKKYNAKIKSVRAFGISGMMHGYIALDKDRNILASAIGTPVAVNAAAGEGGAWGIAVLAAYLDKAGEMPLDDYLDNVIFKDSDIEIADPDTEISKGFEKFMENYNRYLKAEYAAVEQA